MKSLFVFCMIIASTFAWAGENSASPTPPPMSVKGQVLEVMEVESFTYLRLNTQDGEIWAAVVNAHLKKGANVTIKNVVLMNNFESKSLKKVFPTILFGELGTSGNSALGIDKYMSVAHPGLTPAPAHAGLPRIKDAVASSTAQSDEHIPKASGANAMTIEEIVSKAAALKGQPVLVRGKVVKYNAGIMGKNWIHLRDGSGAEARNTNDILVTTTDQVKTGDVITVRGVIATDKDFGAGYSYKVLIEEARVQQ